MKTLQCRFCGGLPLVHLQTPAWNCFCTNVDCINNAVSTGTHLTSDDAISAWNINMSKFQKPKGESTINDKIRIENLKKMVKYQQWYIQFLIGSISKDEFKKYALDLAEPLDILHAIDEVVHSDDPIM